MIPFSLRGAVSMKSPLLTALAGGRDGRRRGSAVGFVRLVEASNESDHVPMGTRCLRMQTMTKQLPDVVIVGGGFARGLAAARALRNAPAFPTSGQPACHGKERDCDSRERENLRPR